MSMSIDGLVSGLGTSDLISQLMQAESLGQTRLKNKVTSQQKVIASFQSVNTRVASLKTATATLGDSSTWSAAKATASSDAITVTAAAGAPTGKLILDMKELAQATVKTSVVSPTGSIQDGTGVSITVAGTTTPVTVETDTAQGVVDAINTANAGVSAALISSDQGSVLQLTATKTGTANDFSISGLAPTLTTITAAADAKIAVGTVGAGGYTVTSATNTFTNLIPNVTITANRVENGISVAVGSDPDAIAAQVQSMVNAANNLISEISSQSAIAVGGAGSTTGGPLTGNSLVRELKQSVLSAVTNGMADYGSFSQLGVQTDRTGKLVFDKATFVAAYQADPAAVASAMTDGLAKSLNDLASSANTNITSAIQSGNNTIRGLNDQVDNWDVRLELRQAALRKQFTNLEVALGKMNEQSSWLASQIASLGTSLEG
ncbi:MAG: flagellar filament capping protein FliD [Dactylosporangium sp.]|nr:flagellar filament capping protein FliD [Dactylosporangium sp.]